MQQSEQIHLWQVALPLQCGGGQLSGAVAYAAGHTQQTAVDLVSTGCHGSQCVGLRQPQIAVTVKADRNRHRVFQCLDIFRGLVGEHSSGRVHDGNVVYTGVLQELCLLCQLRRRKNVTLHQRVATGKSRFLYSCHRLDRACAVTGISAHPQEIQTCVGSAANQLFIRQLCQHKHTDTSTRQVGLHRLEILLVTGCLLSIRLGVSAKALAVAAFNIRNTCLQQRTDDALGQRNRKTMTHHIATVAQGIVKKPDHNNASSFLSVVDKCMRVLLIYL